MTKLCLKCIHRNVCNESVNNFLQNGNDECKYFLDSAHVVQVPCGVGDTVYYNTFADSGKKDVGIQPHVVTDISVIITVDSGTKLRPHEFGESVFTKMD